MSECDGQQESAPRPSSAAHWHCSFRCTLRPIARIASFHGRACERHLLGGGAAASGGTSRTSCLHSDRQIVRLLIVSGSSLSDRRCDERHSEVDLRNARLHPNTNREPSKEQCSTLHHFFRSLLLLFFC